MNQKEKSSAQLLKMRKTTFEIFRSGDEIHWDSQSRCYDAYALFFMHAGTLSCSVGETDYLLTAGDVFVIAPGEEHRWIVDPEKQSGEWIAVQINVGFLRSISIPEQDLAVCFETSRPEFVRLLHPDGLTREMLSYQLSRIYEESSSEEYAAEMYCVGALIQILVVMNRLALSTSKDGDTRSGSDSVVYRVLSYINDHFVEDLSLDSLANQFFISKYHLSREFSHLVGSSVYQYIIQKRLDMAKQMMSAGIPFSEVYQHCGFGDYSNFYRAFKGKYRISPREYVENLKKESWQRKQT